MHRILVFDTTLRDGEQSPGASMTAPEKLRLAHQLDELGVDVLEAGFPISSPAEVDAIRRIAAEVRRPILAALARCADEDIDAAAAALEGAERPRIHVFIATSAIHLAHKLGIDEARCLERAAAAVRRARHHVDDVEFSAEDATRTDPAFLCRIFEAVLAEGATTLNVPDTVGYAHPAEMRRLVETVREGVARGRDDVVLSVHCHDDLGLAVANSLAGIEAGARQVECTVNGIGERAGNAALEEIVMALRTRGDQLPYDTGVRSTELARTSRLLAHITGIHPSPNKAVVGRNAFAHEAGIHQAGMLKDASTYEIMTPDSVGVVGTALVLGKHSGRTALEARYRQLGYELSPEDVDRAYRLFKLLADQKKLILDEDLIAILHYGTMDDVPHRFRLERLEVLCGTREAEADVQLDVGEQRLHARATGDGPLAATFAAVDALVDDHRIELLELSIHAVTPGVDAVGEASVQLRVDGRTFTGRGAAPDVVNAATRAYLHALNKAAHARTLEAAALAEASQAWGV